MIAPEGAGQMPLCAAGKQQEVVHALDIRSKYFISELHTDNTLPLLTEGGREGQNEAFLFSLNGYRNFIIEVKSR